MERIDPSQIAAAILEAPAWARVGITAPTAYLRQDAAVELARAILDSLSDSAEPAPAGQIGLAL